MKQNIGALRLTEVPTVQQNSRMLYSNDLYLGTFLIFCGFVFSLINLKRLIKKNNSSYSSVLISENVLLMCIGIAFIGRSINHVNPANIVMYKIEERTVNTKDEDSMNCNFQSVLLSYGPLIISLVNSFLSLVIDNYMHYRMLVDIKKRDDENTVQEISQEFTAAVRTKVSTTLHFFKEYKTFIIIGLQWSVPLILMLGMYTVNIKELMSNNIRKLDESCVNILDMTQENCSLTNYTEYTLEFRNYMPSKDYLVAYENEPVSGNKSTQIDFVIQNVYKILSNVKNDSIQDVNITSSYLYRKPKLNEKCMKVCYLENKHLLLYIFVLAIASFFIPVTISTIILTKIHMIDVKNSNAKTLVKRELLYNILFWSPLMFDTFLSMLMCSYSMNGMRTSIFNIIANVYQAIKNFMNTKYFKENSITPV